MSQTQDEAIESLLRKQFEGPVSDEGFSQRLMEQLPRRRRRVTWPLWSGILVGVIACWIVLLDSPLLRIGWHDWTNDHWSAPAITVLLVMMGMILLAFVWGVAEAGDR
ncbi:MAG TPA: hypothetical protein VJL61_15575 [Rhodanobacteraceae bacterium]|nr:hypothetical protein [Rhodanobacteraceae bacterium]